MSTRLSPEAKDALKRIDHLTMFSKEGWKRVHKECGYLQNAPHHFSDTELADGFTDYLNIWCDDNGVELDEFPEKEKVYDRLLDRYVDYLERD